MVVECVLPLINVEPKRETHSINIAFGETREMVGKQWIEINCGLPADGAGGMTRELADMIHAGECEVVIRPKNGAVIPKPKPVQDSSIVFIERNKDTPQTQEPAW